jgi:hypothetical protein
MALSNRNEPVLIDLALQGGGSHGAFTWACSIVCSRRSSFALPRSRARRRAR